jgi:hypothetical protein
VGQPRAAAESPRADHAAESPASSNGKAAQAAGKGEHRTITPRNAQKDALWALGLWGHKSIHTANCRICKSILFSTHADSFDAISRELIL